MADNVSISLDEYIKKKKIRRPQTQRIQQRKKKVTQTSGFAVKNKGQKRWKRNFQTSPVRAGGRGGRGAGTKAGRTRGFAFRTSSFRYYNAGANSARRYKQNNSVPRRGRPAGGSVMSQGARRQLLRQLQSIESVPRQSNYRTRVNVRQTGNVRAQKLALRNIGKTRSLIVAQKSLKKARKLLANRRRLLGPNYRAATSTVSGRIRFSNFGILTTRKKDIRETRITMQQRIRRAQLTRERFRQQLTPILQQNTAHFLPAPNSHVERSLYTPPPPNFYSSTVGATLYSDRVFQRPNRSSTPLSSRSTVSSSVRQVSTTTAPLSNRQVSTDDSWIHTPRRILNTSYIGNSTNYGEQSVSSPGARFQEEQSRRPYLDPEIQNRISHIQEQGRRRRPEPTEIAPDFRGPVTSSKLLVGERFKRLMNR